MDTNTTSTTIISNQKLTTIFNFLVTFTQFSDLDMFQNIFQNDAKYLRQKLENCNFDFITFWTSLDHSNQQKLVNYLNNKI